MTAPSGDQRGGANDDAFSGDVIRDRTREIAWLRLY